MQLRKVITDYAPADTTRPTPPRADTSRHTAHGREGHDILIELGGCVSFTRCILRFRVIVTMATVSDFRRDLLLSLFEHFFVDCINLTFV